jgi:hypothetical protein
MGGSLMGGHLTDLKIWLFARSEEGENIKITCKKAWKIISHNNQVISGLGKGLALVAERY